MAGFKTHITFSSILGVGYTGVGLSMGLPIESSLIAGGLCGVGGMLPDIDSDSGIPFRESMCFAAAIIPMLMLDRFRTLGLNHEQIVLVCGSMYLFVRFGVGRLLARYTVHRGMFHSIPAALIFAGVTFLVSGCNDLQLRYFKAVGILIGVMSHLLLDEIYSVEWYRGRWRFKSSFGTALKLWGKSGWANISAYGKLTIVILMILGEPMVMDQYGQLSPIVIQRDQWLRQNEQLVNNGPLGNDPHGVAPPQGAFPVEGTVDRNYAPQGYYTNNVQPPGDPNLPPQDQTIYDTFRRIGRGWRGEAAQR